MSTGRKTFGVAVGALAAGCAVGLTLASLMGTSPSDAASSRAEPTLPAATTSVASKQLREVVRAPCETDRETTTLTAAPFPDGRPLVVTAVGADRGQPLETGTHLVTISGRPTIAVHTDVPFYRDLQVGDVGDDVHRLETALVDVGAIEDADRRFDARAAAATSNLYRTAGADDPASDVGPGGLDLAMTRSVPPGSTVIDVSAAVGDVLEPGAPVLTIGSPTEHATCRVASDVPVRAGDPVELTLGDRTVTGTVLSGDQPGPDSPGRQVTVTPDEALPSDVPGSVEMQVEVAASEGEVLTVPVGALFESADGRLEVRKATSDGYEPVPVETGLASGGFIEVRSDKLVEGDKVHLHASDEPAVAGRS